MKTCPTCQTTYPDDTAFCLTDGTRLASWVTDEDAQLAAGVGRHYRIIHRLGKGGMGTVFLAEQIGVGNRPVALKVLNRKFLDDPDFLKRFENEAASTGRIHHVNVVTIHESAQGDDGTPYIAMEYLEGESLREFLKRSGAISVAQTAEILLQAARGLNAAHKLGIVHRDLKPDNIFMTHGDEGELIVKVVDFGIAKLRESTTHTQIGMVLGTPAYMSSEQAYGMKSNDLDARSDIYSLGVVVYEMLTGRLPFYADTPTGFLRKHIHEQPPSFKTVAAELDIPSEVEAVVMKALKKKREERYASALEFARSFVAATPTVPVGDENQHLASTVMAGAETEMDFDAPLTLSDTKPNRTEKPVPPPLPLPPVKPALESKWPEQPGTPVVKPSDQPTRDDPYKKPPAQHVSGLIYGLIGGAAVVLLAAAVWHFWPSPKPPAVNPLVDKPGVEKPPDVKPAVENPEPRPDAAIVGCYRWFNGGGVAIRSDHTMIGGPFKGKWQMLNAARRTYLLTWPQPTVSNVNLSLDQRSLAGGNQYGGKDVATRVSGSGGLVGTWNWFDLVGSQVTVNSDDTFWAVSPTSSWQGTWQTINPFTGTYQLTASEPPKDTLTLSDDGSRLSGADQYGIAISGTRVANCAP